MHYVTQPCNSPFDIEQFTFKNLLLMLYLQNHDDNIIDACQYVTALHDVIHYEVQHQLSHPMNRRLCMHLCLNLEFEKSKTTVDNAEEQPTITWETTTPVFCSEMLLVRSSNEIMKTLDKSFKKIFNSI